MTATIPDILKYLNDTKTMDQNIETATRSKKRRLDHLTWEEKMLRKKLKNRVAAQTSRDRKKAKMEQMEKAIQELYSRNEAMIMEIENLKEENKDLHKRLAAPCVNCSQSRSVECEPAGGSGSAEPHLPRTGTYSAAALDNQKRVALWKMVLACLLYQTCSTNSTAMSTLTPWSNSLRASFKISPKIWKQLLRKQIAKNQMVIKRPDHWWGRHQKSWNPINPVEMPC